MSDKFEEYLKGCKDIKMLCSKINRYMYGYTEPMYHLTDNQKDTLSVSGVFNSERFTSDFDAIVGINKECVSDYYQWEHRTRLCLNLNLILDDKEQLSLLNNYTSVSTDYYNKKEEVRLAGVQFQINNPAVNETCKGYRRLQDELALKISEIKEQYKLELFKLKEQEECMIEAYREMVRDTCGYNKSLDHWNNISEELKESYDLVIDNTQITFIDE